MNALSRVAVVLALVMGLAAVATVSAEETTLSGTLVCAKCKLKKTDKCQDVLLVTQDGKTTEYFIAKNAAAEEAGHQCSAEAKATVTGEVTEKDGVKWIAASKIEKS
ncbi:MAG TPA: DUF6370 family protein [Vicinamibacterales bacterium]